MAWVEPVGKRSWRVRYRDANRDEQSVGGFRSSKAAHAYAEELATDRRRGLWIDPARSAMSLESWAGTWVETLDVEPRTEENYRRCLRVHVLPRWGSVPLGGIVASEVAVWLKTLRERYAASTVATIRTVFSTCLDDAVDDRLIPTNPVRARRRRGRRRDRGVKPVEKAWAMPEQVVRIANNAAVLGGPTAKLLIITAAWTGCRWGELAGLHRDSVDLDRGTISIHPLVGALHESARELWLGPPKTPASAREIQLSPFLARLLREHLARHDGPMVFPSPRGRFLRRSCFDRRVFRPAVDGDSRRGIAAVKPGLTFHGLRHSHKTWLIADRIPEIAQAMRLGHRLSDKVIETYSHVAPEIERQLLHGLQRRWKHAARTTPRPPDNRPGRKRRGNDPHRAPAQRNQTRIQQPRRNPQASPPVPERSTPRPGAPSAPGLLQAGANSDQHRPWLPIIAETTTALRPAQTPERRAFV